MTEQSNDRVWGVPLRRNFTKIPNDFIDKAIEAGLAHDEFVLIVCLARFHFNTGKGKSKPSLKTLADMTGYSERTLRRRLLPDLKKKGFIDIEYHPGRPSVYRLTSVLPTIQKTLTEAGSADKLSTLMSALENDSADSIVPSVAGVGADTLGTPVSDEEDEVQEGEVNAEEDEATPNNDKQQFLPEGKNKSSSAVGDIDMSPPSMNGKGDTTNNDDGWVEGVFPDYFPEHELTKPEKGILRKLSNEDKYDRTLVEEKLLTTQLNTPDKPVHYLLASVQEGKREAEARKAEAEFWEEHYGDDEEAEAVFEDSAEWRNS